MANYLGPVVKLCLKRDDFGPNKEKQVVSNRLCRGRMLFFTVPLLPVQQGTAQLQTYTLYTEPLSRPFQGKTMHAPAELLLAEVLGCSLINSLFCYVCRSPPLADQDCELLPQPLTTTIHRPLEPWVSAIEDTELHIGASKKSFIVDTAKL